MFISPRMLRISVFSWSSFNATPARASGSRSRLVQLAAAGLSEGVRQDRPHGVLVGVQLAFALALGFRPNLHRVHNAIAAQVLDADFGFDLLQHGGADLIVLWRVGEFHLNQRPLLEIDAIFEAALQGDAPKPSHGQHQRGDDEGPLLAQKVVVRVLE